MAKRSRERRARLRARAETGDALCGTLLGLDLLARAPLRRREGLRWLRRAAELEHREAKREFGARYERGEFVRQSPHPAERWWRGIAMYQIGLASLRGGLPRDRKRAAAWLRRAAELGDPDACLELGELAEQGRVDQRTVVRCLRRAAGGDSAACQVTLGVHLFEGKGTRRDRAQALRWYRKAAEQDVPQAWFNLGQMYRRGHAVRQSWPRALDCYRRAAKQDHARSLEWLIEYHDGQHGAPRNARAASLWVRRAEAAARRGNADVCEVLGDHYGGDNGHGPEPQRALRWLRAGASAGQAECVTKLGIHLFNGAGVKQDRARAARTYRRAAELGNSRAAYLLGLCHAEGDGVRRDRRRARAWFERAAKAGETDARRVLTKLRRG